MDIRFYLGDPSAPALKWSGVSTGGVPDYGIEYSDGTETTVTIERVSGDAGTVAIGAGGEDGSGDASWVSGTVNSNSRYVESFPGLSVWAVRGLVPESSGVFELYGLASSGFRLLRASVDGVNFQSINIVENFTETIKLAYIADINGDIELQIGGSDGDDGSALMAAARLTSTDSVILLTPTQPPQGGELFQFSGSNYAGQPIGPMTFTQGTRTISRAVTISNWNAEDGSFTGVTDTALPGVPAAGASDTPALLYGEPVTISLPDPGA